MPADQLQRRSKGRRPGAYTLAPACLRDRTRGRPLWMPVVLFLLVDGWFLSQSFFPLTVR